MLSVVFTLSTRGPSNNELYANSPRGGRHKTKAYKAWQRAALWELLRQRACNYQIAGRVCVVYDMKRPNDKRIRDAENYAKALSDTLKTAGALIDDSQIDRMSIGWSDDIQGVQITIQPVGE